MKKITNGNKILKLNLYSVVVVCIIFGVINLLTVGFFEGSLIMGMGFALAGIIILSGDKLSVIAKAVIVSVGQTMAIFIIGIIKGNLGEIIVLMIASSVMAGIYFEKKVIIVQGAITNILLITTFIFFKDTAYVGTQFDTFSYAIIA